MNLTENGIKSGKEKNGVKENTGTPLGIESQVVATRIVAAPTFTGNINRQKTGNN